MSFVVVEEGSGSIDNINPGEMTSKSNKTVSLEVASSGGDISQELASAAESLIRIELDLVCSSEKLVNLDILVLHVASKENDFDAFASEEDSISEGSAEKAFQFDILYGYLDSEVRELDAFLSGLQAEIDTASKVVSSSKKQGDLNEMEEKLQDCEKSLKQSFEQLEYIKMQSANFRNILLNSFGDETRNDKKDLIGAENGEAFSMDTKIKMHTLEQQRHVLNMLQKSLAREMDLEKKLDESRLIEEDTKFRMQREVLRVEEEAEILWERWYEAENTAEVMLGVSKDMFHQSRIADFDLNGYIQREGQLRFQCENLNHQLKEKESALRDSEHSRDELVEKVNALEQKLSDFSSPDHSAMDISEQNRRLSKGEATEIERDAKSLETELELLRECNVNLKNELIVLKSDNSDTNKRVEELNLKVRESELRRLHAEATAEASEEKNGMLNRTIEDMENLIHDLKSKASKCEKQIESIEDKCITLSESNAELVGEMNFLRVRSEGFERSLHQANDAKKDIAKDIKMYTKFIADLIVQLALERERIHKQISSLTREKRSAAKHFQIPSMGIPLSTNAAKTKLFSQSNGEIKHKNSRGNSEKNTASSSTDHEDIDSPGDSLSKDKKPVTSSPKSSDETVRNIEPKQMSIKYLFFIVLLSIVMLYVGFLAQQ